MLVKDLIGQIFKHRRCQSALYPRHVRARFLSTQDKDDRLLKSDLSLTGIRFEEIDEILAETEDYSQFYPNTQVHHPSRKPVDGHNLVVIQPWVGNIEFASYTSPDLQLEECVSLGNTISNWKVIGKKILFARTVHRKHIVGPNSFEELKEFIYSFPGVTATMFGIEVLSGIQLATLEKDLKMPVYDRYTTVLNIFRQHARTKEAKIQVALAELPYIRSHLREIHESSDNSSAAQSLKLIVGGAGEKFFHERNNILKRRESRLRVLLEDVKKHRNSVKLKRVKSNIPCISVVGYTNSGKTTLIKSLTQDDRLVPENQLFATLDVSAFKGQLPSYKDVFYIDTVGFLSRIPTLLVEAFSATLADVKASNLILHVVDISHPDNKIQHKTVLDALRQLDTSKDLLNSIITIGNKSDLLRPDAEYLPKCDIRIAASKGDNIGPLVDLIDKSIGSRLNYCVCEIRVPNGGAQYEWLKKSTTMLNCEADQNDSNFLVCKVSMNPVTLGRWNKIQGKLKSVEPMLN